MSKHLLSGIALALWVWIVGSVALTGDPPHAERAHVAESAARLWPAAQPPRH